MNGLGGLNADAEEKYSRLDTSILEMVTATIDVYWADKEGKNNLNSCT